MRACSPILVGAAALALALLAGCGRSESPAAAVERSDSAGIEIVRNPSSALAHSYAALDAEPTVVIGGREGDPAHELFRVSGAAVLADGGIAVVNMGSQEVRFYDGAGEHLRSVGGQGDGPGEFRNPLLAPATTVDSLLVWDFANRFTFVRPDGTFGETRPLRGNVGSPIIRHGNQLLLSGGTARAAMDTPQGLMPNRSLFRILDLVTLDTALVADLEGMDVYLSNDGRSIAFTPVPFDAPASASMNAAGIFIAPGEAPEVRQYDVAGELRRIIRVPIEPRPITRADYDAFVEARVAALRDPDFEPELRRRYGEIPVRPAMPVVGDLRTDAAGNLWAQEYRAEDTDPQRWIVIDSTGAVLGRVAMPAGLRVEQIGRDFVLGVESDALGVETVRRYALNVAADRI